jgi:hypothetical protein
VVHIGETPFMDVGILVDRQSDLSHIVRALCAPASRSRSLDRRQQQSHKHANNGNHDKQLD